MKTYKLVFLFFLIILSSFLSAQEIRIAVIEFEEKNDIGLTNAGRIMAELLVTEIAKLNLYEVQERLLLHKVLEEQNLILSGIIDETHAVEIGKLYGVDAIISGSIMKIGSKINITGRIINVETGKVLKTASVSLDSLDDMPYEAQVLANALCDIPREAFEIREDLAKRAWQRIEIGAGVGGSFNNIDNFSFDICTIIRYTPPLFTLWIEGTPLLEIRNIELGGTYNIIPFLGIGANYGMYFDNAIDYVELSYVHIGFMVRPRINFEFGLFIGGALGGTIHTDDSGPIDNIPGYWNFPSNFDVWLVYQATDDLAIRVKYLGVELGDFESLLPGGYYYPNADYEYIGGKLTIQGIYSFAIGN